MTSRDYTADYLLDLVGNLREKNVDADSTPAVLASYRSGTAMASGDVDEATAYTFDANDRLLTETKDVDVAADDRHTVYAYGASDDITQQTRKTVYQGLNDQGTKLSDTFNGYNLQGRLASVETDTDGDWTTQNQDLEEGSYYTYNDQGIRVSVAEKTDSCSATTTSFL